MKVTTRMILACMCMIVVVFARNTKEEAIVIGQGTATEVNEKAKQIQAKADYYDRLHQSYDAAHGGSSIENWTDTDYTSGLSTEKAAAWGTNVYVPAGRDSDHTFTECVDYYSSEGSWAIYSYDSGYITDMMYFSASYECQEVTLSLAPGWYSFERYDSYGDGGQDSYFDGAYVGSMGYTTYDYQDVEATDPAPSCTDISLTVGGGSYDSEISWDLSDGSSGAAGSFGLCLDDGDYTFNGYDSWGDGWNGASATFTDADGNVLGSFAVEGSSGSWTVTVGGEAPAGCDGYTVLMSDSYGDGWNGNNLTIGDESFTIESGSSAEGCYTGPIDVEVSCGGGSYGSEVSWSINDSDGNEVLAGGAPYTGCLGECGVAGCMDSGADNYNSDATYDDGSCNAYPGMDCAYFGYDAGAYYVDCASYYCVPTSWLGDGGCDSSYFACAELGCDGGDCNDCAGDCLGSATEDACGDCNGGCSVSGGGCTDTDNGAVDSYGDGCALYASYPSWCGGYDDDDFDSMSMCCACGGGDSVAGEISCDDGSCDCDGNVDLGCGCGEAGPSGCDDTCGSTLENDECGVCGGDNSSCADCAGVPNGDAVDVGCGCGEPGPSGCDDTCGSTLENDECGECGGDNSSCADCAGTPNGDATVDNCGTCDSDSSNDCTADCNGDFGGDAEIDECGVCGGDNSSCADCAGTPYGDAFTDCAGTCAASSYLSWQGDGWCDDGAYGIDFVCADFNCDDGDCGVDLQTDGSCAVSCTDCAGNDCYGWESWIGDGWCDDGAYGFYFDCDDFNCDNGDCIDDCGDCSGGNQSCSDCAGVPNGDSFVDCAGSCVSGGYLSWIGDGFCDDGAWGVDFVTCDGFDYDGGDCDDECGVPLGDSTSCADDCGVPNGDGWSCLVGSGDVDQSGGLDVLDVVGIVNHILGFSSLSDGAAAAADVTADGTINVLDVISIVEAILAAQPEGCDDGYVDDCSGDGDCCPGSWIGDGWGDCEDQAYGCDLTCYDEDGGDCATASDDGGDTDGGDTGEPEGCEGGYIDDCSGDGDCCPESWIGDGFGDCEDQSYGCDLTCYGNDGGDCDESEPSEECADCEFDFTNYGSECCDTAWDEYGIDCASLEANYSWDCSGCSCPGDTDEPADACGDCMAYCVDYVMTNYGYTEADATYWCSTTDGAGCADECADDGGDTDGGSACSETQVEDCSGDGDCCSASWIGDGFGDCEDQAYGCDLTCYGEDGGDCASSSDDGGEPEGCLYDYSAYGAASCDAAWESFGDPYNCELLESAYGWDCAGCECPGDTDDGGDDDSGDDSGECVNDDSTADSYGDTCSSWYDAYEGPGSGGCSGAYDDDDFNAAEQCCVCQGDSRSASADSHLNDEGFYEMVSAKKYSARVPAIVSVDSSNKRTTKPEAEAKSIDQYAIDYKFNKMQEKKSTPVIKGRSGEVIRPTSELDKSNDTGVRLDKASSVMLVKSSTGLTYKADGFVAFEMTLEHGSDFEIAMTSDGFIAGSNTDGTTTKVVVVNHESDELFTSKGDFEIVDIIAATSGGQVLSVEITTAQEFNLGTAYPNPFNPTTSLELAVPENGFVSVNVYNMTGQLVSTLADGNMDAGSYSLVWDASEMSSGMYFVKAVMNGSVNVQKVMLLK